MTVYAVEKFYVNDEIKYQILPYNLWGTVKMYLKYCKHGLFWLLKFLTICRLTEKSAMKLQKKMSNKSSIW